MSPNTVDIKERTPEERQKWLMHKVALHETQIDKLNRAIGLQGYFAENPPISIQTHHFVLLELKKKIFKDFREFYMKNHWFDKKFEEFYNQLEEKYFK